LIPTEVLEGSYTPEATLAFISPQWEGTLISEVMLAFGSVCLFSGFVLICCYWASMLQNQEFHVVDGQPRLQSTSCDRCNGQPLGTLGKFFVYFAIMVSVEACNVSLYLLQQINSEEMILFDSIFLSIVSIMTLAKLASLSSKIRGLLEQIGAINATSTQPQIRRIFAITVTVNLFFLIRVGIECAFTLSVISLMRTNHSLAVIMSDSYWSVYILIRHTSEIAVLALELLISTPIKQYNENNRPRQTISLSPPKNTRNLPVSVSTELTPLVNGSQKNNYKDKMVSVI